MNLFKKTLRCSHRQDIQHHPNCFYKDGNPKAVSEPRQVHILSIDIETLPLLGYSWGVWNQNIYPEQIKKDWCLLSYSAKWVDSANVISSVLSPREAITRNDEKLAKEIWKLLEQADVVIGFNSKRFDIRKINARFLKHGLHKPSSYRHIDIISTARSTFGLTYNKLDFIAEFLGLQRKLETDFQLWEDCDEGNRDALQKMREYNENDVVIQENVYYELREWIPSHPNLATIANLSDVCPVCLGENFQEIGLYSTDSKNYKELRCKCGAVWHDRKSIKA